MWTSSFSLLSLLLLGASGWMLDAHRRDWLRVAPSTDRNKAWHFARARYLRRMTATGAIALVGVLVGIWPMIPQQPRWVLAYTGVLSLLALLILSFGFYDAFASGSYYSEKLREESSQHRQDLMELIESEHRTNSQKSKED